MFQVRKLCYEKEIPLLIAGDLFEEWNCPPELINYVTGAIPRPSFAVPGNHDLPHHNYKEIRRSAYWTLVEAQVIHNLVVGDPVFTPSKDLVLYGFPFDHPPRPVRHKFAHEVPDLALVHAYCWKKGKVHINADPDDHWVSLISRLKGFTYAVFGDNHRPFMAKNESTTLINCGCLIRRKIDEMNQKPSLGLVWSDGTITRHFLECDRDVFFDGREERVDVVSTRGITDVITKSVDNEVDFKETLRKEAEKQEEGVKREILRAVENGQ